MPTVEDILALWNFGDPAGSEARFREALATSDPNHQAEWLTQIARAQGLQRRFDEAHATLARARLLIDSGTRAEVRYQLEVGRVLNSSGLREASVDHFAEALKLAGEQKEDYLAVDAAHMLGIASPAEEGLNWNLKAIQMAENSTQETAKRWLASLLNNTAWSLHDLGRPEEALPLFQKAVERRIAMGDTKGEHIARYCVGKCLRTLGRFTEALDIQERLEPDGYVLEELAELHLALGNQVGAKAFFELAFQELSKDEWLKANEPERLARLGSF